MCKFSIIVPVYNTEKYLEKCLNSLTCQTFTDYEIIIIDDGSTDASFQIIKRYLDNPKIRFISRENRGVASTRNEGILLARGKYILFVDSDDYIDNDLLNQFNMLLVKDYGLIKYQYAKIKNGSINEYVDSITLNKEYSPEEYMMESIKAHKPFDIMCIYLYKKDIFINNNLKFKENTYHEDFGLIPLIILKSENIYVTDFVGYYYNQEGSSITRGFDYQKILKKAYDMLMHFYYLYVEVNKLNLDGKLKKYFNSYISNGLIGKIDTLNKEDRKKYIKELKIRKVFDLIVDDTLIRKLKKMLLKIKY